MNRRDQSIEKHQPNSNLEDHGRVDMPAGPLSRQTDNRPISQSMGGATVQKETIRPQTLRNDTVRSAVVKPKPKVLGDGTLRYDQPASPAPKLRQVAKLEKFVRFLEERERGEVVNELTEESLRIRAQVLAEAAEKLEAAAGATTTDLNDGKTGTNAPSRDRPFESSESQSRYRFSPLTTNASAMKDFYVQGITEQPKNTDAVDSKEHALPPEQAQQIWAEFEQAQRHPVSGLKANVTPKKMPPKVKRNLKPIVVLPSDVSQQRRERTLVDIVVPGLSQAREAAREAAHEANTTSAKTNEGGSSDDVPQKAFFVRKTTDGQMLTLPEVRHRYDHSHESRVKAPRAHVRFTEESQIQNERQYQQSVARDRARDQEHVQVQVDAVETAKSDLGAPNHPFSSVTYDEATANVVATISAAIASVIRDESEQKLKEQADRLLRSVHQQAALENEVAKSALDADPAAVADEIVADSEEIAINEDMLNDIVRQRFENFADADTVNRLLNERIDSHQATVGPTHHQPEATPDDDSPTHAGQPITSITAFAEAQPSLSSAPAVVTASMVNDLESESEAAEYGDREAASVDDVQGIVDAIDTARMMAHNARPILVTNESSQSVEVIDEIPLELAAWDVEDFRWPVVSNQMIVTGGAAIEGLLAATLEQLPHRPRRIAVSGVGRVHGTTSLAISVSRWAAAAGHRTLLIDADVASPSLSGKLGVASNMSWLNGINNELPVSELVIRSRKTNLCVMPLASSVTRVTWPRFIFDNLGEVLEPIRNRFDLIVIDAGPASQLLDELSSPARLLDAVMLVNDVTEAKKLETFKTRLETFGVERLIVADNRVPQASTNVA